MRVTKNTWEIIFFNFYVFFCFSALGQLRISEVMFNPTGPEQTDEFIEIVNLDTALSINLADWRISDGEGADRIVDAGEGIILGPDAMGLILDPDYFGASSTYEALIPPEVFLLTIDGSTFGSGGLSNSHAETVCLVDPYLVIVDSVIYSIDISPGHSFEKIRLDDSGSLNWKQSRAEYGTPGFRNSMAPASCDLAIIDFNVRVESGQIQETVYFEVQVFNAGLQPVTDARLALFREILQDSMWTNDEQIDFQSLPVLQSGDTLQCIFRWQSEHQGLCHTASIIFAEPDEIKDNNGIEKTVYIPYPPGALVINEIMYEPMGGSPEWVELYNTLAYPVNLNGWFISDADTQRSILLSSSSLFISPSDFLVLYGGDSADFFPVLDAVHCLAVDEFPSLNNTEDSIFLFDLSGQVIDYVNFKCSWGGGDGVSLERIYWNSPSEDSSNWYGCILPEGMSPGIRNSLSTDFSGNSDFTVNPNPFSPDGDGMDEVTCIHFRLPFSFLRISLYIYDVRGRRIRDLRNGQLCCGEETILWDGLDNSGQKARTGIYILYLQAIHHESGSIIQKKRTVVLAKTT